MQFVSLKELEQLEGNITASIRAKTVVLRYMIEKGDATQVANCSQEIKSLQQRKSQISSQIEIITSACATLSV